MRVTRLSVRRMRPLARSSGHAYTQPSTSTTSKTEIASSESIRGRALAAVEYGNGLTRTGRRRAQGRRPPPDARTRAGALNAPDASPPNTGHGRRDREQAFVPSFFLQPSPPNDPGRVRTREKRMGRLIRTPSRHPRSALRISAHYTASDPRPNRVPSWGRVGRRQITPQQPRRVCRHIVQACDR